MNWWYSWDTGRAPWPALLCGRHCTVAGSALLAVMPAEWWIAQCLASPSLCLYRYADIVPYVTLILSLPLRWYCIYRYADIVSAVTLILSLPLRCYFNKGRRWSDLLKRCFFSSLLQCTRVHFMKVLCCEKLGQESLLRMVRWMRWHCPSDIGFEIRAVVVWGRARYLSVELAISEFPSSQL